MATETERTAVEKLISAYAEAVNSGNHHEIPSLYTSDGLLMPDGYTSVPQGKSRGSFLKGARFQISFSIKEIVIDGQWAFVEACADTRITGPGTDLERNKRTRDLFVLRSTEGAWKIFRYIFNQERRSMV